MIGGVFELKKICAGLTFLLTVSLAANAYLVYLVVGWQDAWLEQFMTTSNVELLYRKSGADISFESVSGQAEDLFGKYEIAPAVGSDKVWSGVGEKVIIVDGTKLFFKNGQYIGSKADLPEGLQHWRFGTEP